MQLLIPLVIMVGALWFMSRSQKKQQQERQNKLNAMKVGDEIVTIGGLHGVLDEIRTEKGTIVIDREGILLESDRAAVKSSKASAEAVENTTTDEDEDEEEPEHYEAPKITRPDDEK